MYEKIAENAEECLFCIFLKHSPFKVATGVCDLIGVVAVFVIACFCMLKHTRLPVENSHIVLESKFCTLYLCPYIAVIKTVVASCINT